MSQSIKDELLQALAGKSGGEIVETLFGFMKQRGNSNYDESVTQLEHALQCADLANQKGLGDTAVTAALFHDIGHLLLDEHDAQDGFLAEDMNHEVAGGDLLDSWFPEAVTEPVRLHVAAKRYLCSTEASYYEQLSDASKRSFEVQGGKLSDEEQAEFGANPHIGIAVELRRLDDLGKVSNKDVPGIEAYTQIVERSLKASA